jgi:hypothetical protein
VRLQGNTVSYDRLAFRLSCDKRPDPIEFALRHERAPIEFAISHSVEHHGDMSADRMNSRSSQATLSLGAARERARKTDCEVCATVRYSKAHPIVEAFYLSVVSGGDARFEEGDKCNFGLKAAMIAANRREHEQTSAPESQPGFQGEGGGCPPSRAMQRVDKASRSEPDPPQARFARRLGASSYPRR